MSVGRAALFWVLFSNGVFSQLRAGDPIRPPTRIDQAVSDLGARFDAERASLECGSRALFVWLRLLGFDAKWEVFTCGSSTSSTMFDCVTHFTCNNGGGTQTAVNCTIDTKYTCNSQAGYGCGVGRNGDVMCLPLADGFKCTPNAGGFYCAPLNGTYFCYPIGTGFNCLPVPDGYVCIPQFIGGYNCTPLFTGYSCTASNAYGCIPLQQISCNTPFQCTTVQCDAAYGQCDPSNWEGYNCTPSQGGYECTPSNGNYDCTPQTGGFDCNPETSYAA